MTVWVVFAGEYEQTGVMGVYSSMDAVRTAYPVEWTRQDSDGCWYGPDHDGYCAVPFEVDDLSPSSASG